jgi:para-nitrobenzyl esterase
MGKLSAASEAPGPVASVAGGTIVGRFLPDGRGAVFKGIPFARAPVGEFRWREPLPVVPWAGTREAFNSGPPAEQPALGWNDQSASASREDCLYLDVWTPMGPTTARVPVMVWFHGGANVAGAGGFDPLYEGAALVGHGVVLVVVEYRLGIFGFFAHPELTQESAHHASGNYAILDQIAALQWVRANITQFGGDPGNVTIFGQSAGSIDTLALMATPLSRGLFNRAIAESGTTAQAGTLALGDAERLGASAAAGLNAPGIGALSYLRSLPSSELLKAGGQFNSFTSDGWVFPISPEEVWSAGKERPVPLIIGSNAIEFPAQGSPAELRNAIRGYFKELAPKALALYGLSDGGPAAAVDPVYGDAADQWGSDLFRCPAVIHGEWHSGAANPVWEYEFDRAIPPRPRVGHSSELPYVFGNLLPTGGQGGDFQEADRRLSGVIQAYWTNFAKSGNPNGPGLPEWPNFDTRGRSYLDFTLAADAVVRKDQRGGFCDLFRERMERAGAPR